MKKSDKMEWHTCELGSLDRRLNKRDRQRIYWAKWLTWLQRLACEMAACVCKVETLVGMLCGPVQVQGPENQGTLV